MMMLGGLKKKPCKKTVGGWTFYYVHTHHNTRTLKRGKKLVTNARKSIEEGEFESATTAMDQEYDKVSVADVGAIEAPDHGKRKKLADGKRKKDKKKAVEDMDLTGSEEKAEKDKVRLNAFYAANPHPSNPKPLQPGTVEWQARQAAWKASMASPSWEGIWWPSQGWDEDVEWSAHGWHAWHG